MCPMVHNPNCVSADCGWASNETSRTVRRITQGGRLSISRELPTSVHISNSALAVQVPVPEALERVLPGKMAAQLQVEGAEAITTCSADTHGSLGQARPSQPRGKVKKYSFKRNH